MPLECTEFRVVGAKIKLDDNNHSSFFRLQPTSDDIKMYEGYRGNRKSLQAADQFMMQLCDIPNLNLRLDALVTIMELPTQFEELEPVRTFLFYPCRF